MKKFIFTATVLLAFCLISVSVNAQNTPFIFTNSSGMVVTGVSISPAGTNTWGTNINTSGDVMIDRTFEYTRPADMSNCLYDVRYLGADGNYYYVNNVNMCTTTSLTLPKPETRESK